MNPNQYSLVKHTILPLIYRVVHAELHKISIVEFSFYFSLPSQWPQNQRPSHAWLQFLNPQTFLEYTKTQLIRNLTRIQKQTQVHLLQWRWPRGSAKLHTNLNKITNCYSWNSRRSQTLDCWWSFCVLYRCQRVSESFQSSCSHTFNRIIN